MSEGSTMKFMISHKDFKNLVETQPGRIILCDDESLECHTVYDVPDIHVWRWIPCSERLPKETNDYLVTMIHSYRDNDDLTLVAKVFCIEGHWLIDKRIYKPIAWMPLPGPYKE